MPARMSKSEQKRKLWVRALCVFLAFLMISASVLAIVGVIAL